MVTPAETLRRVGRLSRILAGFQTAKGTIVDDFTTAAAAVVWAENVKLPAHLPKNDVPDWMTQLETQDESSRHSLPDRAAGQLIGPATPKNIEWFLRSNWGPFAAGSFSLASQINEWLTLAYVESISAGSTERLVRIRDAWIHRLTVSAAMPRGLLILQGDWAGRRTSNRLLNAGAPVVLPASPMTPPDFGFFAVRTAEFLRDPIGLNERIRFSNLEIQLEQQVRTEHTATDGWEVWKQGKAKVRVVLRGNVSEETWALIDANRAGTKFPFRLVAVSSGGSPMTLTIDLQNVDFTFENIGFDPGRRYVDFEAEGMAGKSTGGFATITLT